MADANAPRVDELTRNAFLNTRPTSPLGGHVTIWLNESISMQFRIIDGLSIRFAQSDVRIDHACC